MAKRRKVRANTYLLAIGSNRGTGRYIRPAQVVVAAISQLARRDLDVLATSPMIQSAAIGPSRRCYTNGALVVRTELPPRQLLDRLKAVERGFGRRSGQRWGPRPLDLDIILWDGGTFTSRSLTIPHKHWQDRPFVALPAATIASNWRVGRASQRVRHVAASVQKRKALTSAHTFPISIRCVDRHDASA